MYLDQQHRAWGVKEEANRIQKVLAAFALRFKMVRLIPFRKETGGARPIACGGFHARHRAMGLVRSTLHT